MMQMRVAAVFVGSITDGGFNASAQAGIEAARTLPGVEVLAPIAATYAPVSMATALDLAAQAAGPGGLALFVGGQGDDVAPGVAARWADRRFAVVQGSVVAPNLSSYHLRQDDSAYLAGVLAAHASDGTVGHLSGHRVRPGLRGRAAFVAGARNAIPDIRVLTAFCGTQDDPAVAEEWTAAIAAAGADPIFTMLNAARSGAVSACRAAGVRQIGNALDWVAVEPDVFVASALARIDHAVLAAVQDAADCAQWGRIVEFGIGASRDGEPLVGLSLRGDVGAAARAAVAAAAAALATGQVAPWSNYDGPEFVLERAS